MNLQIFKVLIILIIFSSQVLADDNNKELSFYTGTFDVIDKEGDDQTTLFGVEHKNPDLFRDTFLGKFKPVSGAFITGNSSVYLYTGIEGQYGENSKLSYSYSHISNNDWGDTNPGTDNQQITFSKNF